MRLAREHGLVVVGHDAASFGELLPQSFGCRLADLLLDGEPIGAMPLVQHENLLLLLGRHSRRQLRIRRVAQVDVEQALA